MKQATVVFIILFSSFVWAQENTRIQYSKTPLVKVLNDIEKRFKIKFSYDPGSVDSVVFNYSSDANSLESILNSIEAQTTILIEKVSERYYILTKQRQIDLTKTQELQEVFIAEYLTTGIRKKDGSSVTVSPNKLGILPGLTEPDVLQSLQLIPGVQSPTETASGLFIREVPQIKI